MTNEQIRIAVAKACGWEQITQKTVDGGVVLFRDLHGIKPPLRGWMPIPNYPADLNACYKMEEVLSAMQDDDDYHPYLRYCDILSKNSIYDAIGATARQRCEAFLKVKGLWHE